MTSNRNGWREPRRNGERKPPFQQSQVISGASHDFFGFQFRTFEHASEHASAKHASTDAPRGSLGSAESDHLNDLNED
jgi:hypothetical protein